MGRTTGHSLKPGEVFTNDRPYTVAVTYSGRRLADVTAVSGDVPAGTALDSVVLAGMIRVSRGRFGMDFWEGERCQVFSEESLELRIKEGTLLLRLGGTDSAFLRREKMIENLSIDISATTMRKGRFEITLERSRLSFASLRKNGFKNVAPSDKELRMCMLDGTVDMKMNEKLFATAQGRGSLHSLEAEKDYRIIGRSEISSFLFWQGSDRVL